MLHGGEAVVSPHALFEEAFMKPYYIEMEEILDRLRVLGEKPYSQSRSYRREDGTWVDREITPEYKEEMQLLSKWGQLQKYDLALSPGREHNSLLIQHRLQLLISGIESQKCYDAYLLWRIAITVYGNEALCR